MEDSFITDGEWTLCRSLVCQSHSEFDFEASQLINQLSVHTNDDIMGRWGSGKELTRSFSSARMSISDMEPFIQPGRAAADWMGD